MIISQPWRSAKAKYRQSYNAWPPQVPGSPLLPSSPGRRPELAHLSSADGTPPWPGNAHLAPPDSLAEDVRDFQNDQRRREKLDALLFLVLYLRSPMARSMTTCARWSTRETPCSSGSGTPRWCGAAIWGVEARSACSLFGAGCKKATPPGLSGLDSVLGLSRLNSCWHNNGDNKARMLQVLENHLAKFILGDSPRLENVSSPRSRGAANWRILPTLPLQATSAVS